MKKKIRRNQYQESQPAEWEEFLKDVTIERDEGEIPYDSSLITTLQTNFNFQEIMDFRMSHEEEMEFHAQIELVTRIVKQKLDGPIRDCLLLLLSTGASSKRIAELMNLSEDTIQRYIKRGIRLIKQCLKTRKTGHFPVQKNKRPTYRVVVFPLDTAEEQMQFQQFLNQEIVVHISYRGEELFREVLVVYLTGKSVRKWNRER